MPWRDKCDQFIQAYKGEVTLIRPVWQGEHVGEQEGSGVCAGLTRRWIDCLTIGEDQLRNFRSMSEDELIEIGKHLHRQRKAKVYWNKAIRFGLIEAMREETAKETLTPDSAEIYLAKIEGLRDRLNYKITKEMGPETKMINFVNSLSDPQPGIYQISVGGHRMGLFIPSDGEYSYFFDPNMGEFCISKRVLQSAMYYFMGCGVRFELSADGWVRSLRVNISDYRRTEPQTFVDATLDGTAPTRGRS